MCTHAQECRRAYINLLRWGPRWAPIRKDELRGHASSLTAFASLRVFLSDLFDNRRLPRTHGVEVRGPDPRIVLLVLELLGRETSNVQSLFVRDVNMQSPELVNRLVDVLATGKWIAVSPCTPYHEMFASWIARVCAEITHQAGVARWLRGRAHYTQ